MTAMPAALRTQRAYSVHALTKVSKCGRIGRLISTQIVFGTILIM